MVKRDRRYHQFMWQLLPHACVGRAAVAKIFVFYKVLTFRKGDSSKCLGVDQFKHFVTSMKRVGVETSYERVPEEIAVFIYVSV